MITTSCSLLMVAFISRCKPMQEKINNFLEILNESTFLTLTYLNFLFTDFVSDIDMRYNIGWIFLGVLGLNVVINFAVIIVTVLK